MINWLYLAIAIVIYFVFIDMDDDDDQDGGKLIPAYQRPDQWPILHLNFCLTMNGSVLHRYHWSQELQKQQLKLKKRSQLFMKHCIR